MKYEYPEKNRGIFLPLKIFSMKETIRFTIKQDGTVLETVEGVYGAHCENLTSEVEDSLGVVYFKEETSDRYVTNRIGQEQHVTL